MRDIKGRSTHDKSGTRGWKVDKIYTIFNTRTNRKENTADYYEDVDDAIYVMNNSFPSSTKVMEIKKDGTRRVVEYHKNCYKKESVGTMRRPRRLIEDVGRNSLHEITTYLSEIESMCNQYRNSPKLWAIVGMILSGELPTDPATIKGVTMTLQEIEEELKRIYESMYDIGPDLIGELEMILDSIDGRY